MTESILADGYKVHIGPEALGFLDEFVSTRPQSSKCIVIADENTAEHCHPILLESVTILQDAPLVIIPAGDHFKNLSTVELILRKFVEMEADRDTLIVNLGGGVVGDVGGFAASVFMRGVDFIQVPTTLLSMVDAAVGGKTGVNFDGRKNLVGAFSNPSGVCIDPRFLASLPLRELRSGFAEVIKHALINPEDHWHSLPKPDEINRHYNWTESIVRSVRFKNSIVQSDFRDHHVRNVLNFGHTLGHAMEGVSLRRDKDPLLHGEAVAIGMMAALLLSVELTGFDEQEAEKLIHYIQSVYSDIKCPAYDDQIAEFLVSDKKSRNGELRFVLLGPDRSTRLSFPVGEADAANALNTVASAYLNSKQHTGV